MAQAGKPIDIEIVRDDELTRTGAALAKGQTPEARNNDPLERYIAVPNRMYIFYSSEDEVIDAYIRNNWAALDRLSGEYCDIYTSLLQLENNEDAYSAIGEMPNIPGANEISIGELPVILIWSDSAYAKIPIRSFASDKRSLLILFRYLIGALRTISRGISAEDGGEISRALNQAASEARSHVTSIIIYIDSRKDMSTKNFAGAGSVINTGTGGDISLNQNWSSNDADLVALANELEALRKALKTEGTSVAHGTAVRHVAAAEAAARRGDKAGVDTALKTSGKWVIDVAEKIGVGLAVRAITSAIGL